MDEEEFEEFFDFYHQSGSPEKAPEALSYYVNSDYLNVTPHFIGPANYLFSRVAENQSDVLRGYESVLTKADSRGRVFILSLLGAVGDERTQDLLESLIADPAYEDVQADIEEALTNLPNQERVEPLRQDINEPSDLDLLWAEFALTGNTQAVSRIIQVLDWRDIFRENLDAWMRLGPGFHWFGLSTRWRRRRLKLLRRIAGIECDFERKRIETVEDLDCLIMVRNLEISSDRIQEIRTVAPFLLSQEEVNHLAVKAAAKWSLARNAERYPTVLGTCEEEISSRNDRTRLALLEIVVNVHIVQGNFAMAVERLREYLQLNPSHIEMNRALQLAEADAELDQLMELSKSSTTWVSDVREPSKIANKCVEVTRTAAAYFSRRMLRFCAEEDLESSDCDVWDWRLRYSEPHQFHVEQFMSPSDYDKWMSFGPDTYQNVGFWYQTKDDSHKDLNLRLLTDEWLRILEAGEPLSAATYSFSGENFVLLEYDTTEFQEGTLHDLLAENPLISSSNIEIWVHSETNFLAKAALIFGGRDSDGKEVHGDHQHVFSGYDADIRISPPQNYSVLTNNGDA